VNPAPNDQRPWARQVPQGVEGAFGPPRLDDGDGHDHEDEAEQHDRFGSVAKKKIQTASDDQHDEHGLAHNFEHNGQQAVLLLRG